MLYAENLDTPLSDREWKNALETWIRLIQPGEKILTLPPVITRCYSYAGKITA